MLKKKDALNEWEREFGDIEKVTDFSGRKMARSAYNNNHSRFGWTVACILPESKGGEFMTHNMVCCNIDSYIEKGENFPLFTANGHSYAIKSVDNAYRILVNNARNQDYEDREAVFVPDFRKGKEGTEFWHSCDEVRNSFFAGYVKINVIVDNFGKLLLNRFRIFIENVFELPVIRINKKSDCNMELTLIDFCLRTKEDTKRLVSKCMTLNTYANFYFNEVADCRINIYCGMREYISDGSLSPDDVAKDISEIEPDYNEALAIDELINRNSGAGKRKQIGEPVNGFYKFNFCYKDLRSELSEEVDLENMDKC